MRRCSCLRMASVASGPCSSVWGIMICALSGTRSRRWLTAKTRMPGMSATHRSLPCMTTCTHAVHTPACTRRAHAVLMFMWCVAHLIAEVDGVRAQLLLLRTDAR